MEIVQFPGPPLRRGGKPVETFDAGLAELAQQMLATMYESQGVGLAAPQVGLALELLVLNPSGDPAETEHEMVMANPKILERKGNEFGEEGCLSFPGLYADVQRNKKITVTYQDLDGTAHELRAEGFLARIIQHEIDHLKGVLFVDRLSTVEKMRVRNELELMESRYQAARVS